jgi:hypothetical protein
MQDLPGRFSPHQTELAMTYNRTLMATAAGISLALVATSGAAANAAAPATTAPHHASLTHTAVAVKDGRVAAGMIRVNRANLTRLSVHSVRGYTRIGLVRFSVPARPAGYRLDHATLTFDVVRTTAAALVLRTAANRWGHRAVRYRASAVGPVVDRSPLRRGQRTLRFDVTTAVPHPGAASFVISELRGSTTLRMKTRNRHATPRLQLSYRSTAAVAAAPATAAAPAPRSLAAPAATAASTASTTTTVRIGMSAPTGEWSSRLAETGGVDARRIFGNLGSPSGAISTATSEVAAGRLPILSFKVANNDWAGVAAGRYDVQLRALTTRLAALKGKAFVTLHHEPTGDGTPADYAAMMAHALPILGAPANVSAGPIVNGFWWSNGGQGRTDAQIAQWLPSRVLKVSEVVAADTYQGGTTAKPGENAGVKIANLSKWATRVGVAHLGIGEYNGLNASSITAAGNAVLADPRFSFAAAFDSNVNNRAGVSWQLTGARLTAFKATIAAARAARVG